MDVIDRTKGKKCGKRGQSMCRALRPQDEVQRSGKPVVGGTPHLFPLLPPPPSITVSWEDLSVHSQMANFER